MPTRNKTYLNPEAKPTRTIQVHQPAPKDKRYATNQWRQFSKRFRATNPMCGMCGLLFLADQLQTDHIIPIHLGGAFFDRRNVMPLCLQCHAVKTRKEAGGIAVNEFTFNEQGDKIPAWSL